MFRFTASGSFNVHSQYPLFKHDCMGLPLINVIIPAEILRLTQLFVILVV